MDSDPEQARTLDVQCPVSKLLQLKLGAQVSGKQGLDPGSLGLPDLCPSAQAAPQPERPPSCNHSKLPSSCSHPPSCPQPSTALLFLCLELQAVLLWISPLPLLELGFLVSKPGREISTHTVVLSTVPYSV